MEGRKLGRPGFWMWMLLLCAGLGGGRGSSLQGAKLVGPFLPKTFAADCRDPARKGKRRMLLRSKGEGTRSSSPLVLLDGDLAKGLASPVFSGGSGSAEQQAQRLHRRVAIRESG
ncbi:hypothetical protein QBC34DRAFT_422259 [Podospora aff. communis PSN243]|uniref:Uncharacterized protein n=1 Tax=Podospora aff. communis PSN243 TaxID=3040156 RepID=A0AAV9H0R2_9PEZI|nr:hypothetical protein QBC34DRAFT_422259 [Podospora aff. communis PSN243]